MPAPESARRGLAPIVLVIDRFGNVSPTPTRAQSTRSVVQRATASSSALALDRYYAIVAETFADAGRGELILYEDSYGLMTLAISNGDAAGLTGVGPGDEIRIAAE